MTRESVAGEFAVAPEQPRLYYGWLILLVGILTVICSSPGQTFGIAMFYTALREDLGLSNTWLTGTYMIATLLAAAPMTHMGMLMDRWGLRRTLALVAVLLSLSCVVMAFVQNTWMLFIAFFLLRLFGQGGIVLLGGAMLAFWFERKLGRVEGIRFCGIAFAMAVVPDLCVWLIDALGWRMTYLVLGASVFAIMMPMLLIFRNRPEDVGQFIDGDPAPHHLKNREGTADIIPVSPLRAITTHSFTLAQCLRTKAFWILLVASGYFAFSLTAAIFAIRPIFESRGLSTDQISIFFKAMPLALVTVQLFGGVLADFVKMHYLLAASISFLTGGLFMLRIIDSTVEVIICGTLVGAAQGLLATSSTPLVPRYFGRQYFGRIRGFWTMVVVACSSVGPLVLGLSKDYLESFDAGLTLLAVVPIPIVILCLFATRPVHPDEAAEAAA